MRSQSAQHAQVRWVLNRADQLVSKATRSTAGKSGQGERGPI